MCGRAVHPTEQMREHARTELHKQSCREMIARLGTEINDRQQMRAVAKKTLRQLEQADRGKPLMEARPI